MERELQCSYRDFLSISACLIQRLIALRNGHSCCRGVTHWLHPLLLLLGPDPLFSAWVQCLSILKAHSVVQLTSVMVSNYTYRPTVCACVRVCLLFVCVERLGQDCCWLINGYSCGLPQHWSTCDWCGAVCRLGFKLVSLLCPSGHLKQQFFLSETSLCSLIQWYFIGTHPIVSYKYIEGNWYALVHSSESSLKALCTLVVLIGKMCTLPMN